MPADSEADRRDERVLILAPSGRDAPAAAGILAKAGIAAETFADMPGLCEALKAGAGAILVSEEGLLGGGQKALLASLADQPKWSELPILIVNGKHHRPRPALDTDFAQANVVLLERPMRAAILVSAVRSALRARRRQYEVRDHLDEQASHRAELSRLNAGLEQRVAERTRELEEAMKRQREAEAALHHAQKMEAIGQLTGGIAHDFNNLLMAVMSGLDLMERTDDPARRERIAKAMRQSAERGRALVAQLLAFARRMTLTPDLVRLRELLDGMQILVQGALRPDIAVEIELADDLWPIFADPTQLELALLNLAVNARDAMAGAGRLTISARNRSLDGTAAGGLDGDFVAISVRDTGSGMPPELVARIFEPFFTTKPSGKGTGLGLSQVYGFVQQSGGHAEVHSEVGSGTEIVLYLPRADGTAAQVESTDARTRDAARPGGERSALLVEDGEDVAMLTKEMLEHLGFVVERVSAAEEALARFDDGFEPDLVLSDIMMPGGMNGVELARELKRRRPELPVLLTSGYAAAVRDFKASEDLPILQKPYSLEALEQALESNGALQD